MIEFDRQRDWKTRGGTDIDGHGLGEGYRWLLSVYVFSFHLALGRSASVSPFPHRRIWCLSHGGHKQQINNMEDRSRRWWCPECGTVWPA